MTTAFTLASVVGRSGDVGIRVAGVIAFAVVVGSGLMFMRVRLRFTLDSRGLRFTRGLVEREIFSTHGPGKVVRASVAWLWVPFPFWSLVNSAGEGEATVNASLFDPDRLEVLRGYLGIESEVSDANLTPAQAVARYPGIFPRWFSYANELTIGVVALIIVILALA
jgi:hypothetical protein